MTNISVVYLVRSAIIAGALAASTVPASAQRPSRPSSASVRPAPATVRAEFASVLLQAGRYEEAAREFRALLARDAESFDYRLGLARALAWGEHPREAEAELRRLAARRPGTAAVDSLLRNVRASFDPRAVDAAAWVASEPWYQPYRLALARALVREGMPRLAIAHFDTLLLRGGVASTDRGILFGELIDAYVAAGDPGGGADRLRQALQAAPADTGLRHRLAVLLADSRRFSAASAQYDSLIGIAPTAVLLLERARTRLALGDRAGAQADLSASLASAPAADTYLLLGTIYRERGDYRAARAMYDAARGRRDRRLGLSLAAERAQLAREARPVVAFAPALGADSGWRLTEDAAIDNLGVGYSALMLSRIVPVAASTLASVGVEYRQLAERTSGRTIDASGYGGSIGLSHERSIGWLLARASVVGGLVYHPLVKTLPEGSAGVAAWVGPWMVSAEVASAAAYPTLFTTASLLPPGGGDPIVERRATFSGGGPLGLIDVAVSWEESRLSDGNSRRTMQGYARYPLAPHLFAVYSGSAIQFGERSTLYWDPERYASHAAGVELSRRQPRGFTVVARVMPAYASSLEASTVPGTPGIGTASRGPLEQRHAAQLSADGEAAYRAHHWEAAAWLGYGRGRAGSYQRLGASIAVRIAR